MRNFKDIFWIIGLYVFVIACDNNESSIPANLIPEDKLIPLLADFHLMDAAAKQNIVANNHKTLVKHKQYLGVLKMHGYTTAEFDSTISYHVKHPAKFKIIYEKIDVYLKVQQEKIEDEQTK